jgi:hypothetical protein
MCDVTEGGGEGVSMECISRAYRSSVGVEGERRETGLGEDGSLGMLIGVMLRARRAVGECGGATEASVSISVAVVELRREDGGRKTGPVETVAERGRLTRSGLA